MKITSNTLVKNGMPFIGKVLKQVAPYMDEMVICISQGSNDGTKEEIMRVMAPYQGKIVWMTEDVKFKEELTEVENDMVKKSSGDWVLFLSDDDYWLPDQLELCLKELDKDASVLSYSVNPYQLIDLQHYDKSWSNKFFAKFLRNKDLNFKGLWPAEMPYSDCTSLYWKDSKDVAKVLPYRFYHLANLKEGSFRKETWASRWRYKIGTAVEMPHEVEI